MIHSESKKIDLSDKDALTKALYFEGRVTKEIGIKSAKAVCQLWEPIKGTFWRSTQQRKDIGPANTHFYPSVTYRSTEALLDLLLYYPEWLSKDEQKKIRESFLPAIFTPDIKEVDSSMDGPTATTPNPFTIALYVIALAKALNTEENRACLPTNSSTKISDAIRLLVDTFKPASDISTLHPFIQFHIVRAFKLAIPILNAPDKKKVERRIERILKNVCKDIESLLAKHVLNELSPGDAVAIIFCAATLAFTEREEVKHYILPALELGFGTQDSYGCWPMGRVLPEDKKYFKGKNFVEISSYEIAWTATEVLLRLARNYRVSLLRGEASVGFDGLLLARSFTSKSSVKLETTAKPNEGWCSDHPYRQPFIESWTSGAALQSIISLQELTEEINREHVLSTFVTLDPRDEGWPTWLSWNKYRVDSEPEDSCPILEYVDKKIVKAILTDPRKLPSAENETVSILLFGPPGTSKTTLAQGVATALGWPLVLLSPGDFIKEGLEYIEAQSRLVFDRLQKLSRSVVLFDECDELFRNRQPLGPTEQTRGITAFVTASMLPKLQDLHDRGKVLFFICTNKLNSLDSAIKRSGRIDHIIAVGPPQSRYRTRLISDKFRKVPGSAIKNELIQILSQQTDRFIRKEVIRACDLLLVKKGIFSNKTKGENAVHRIVEGMKDSLTIEQTEYATFNEEKKRFSRPVVDGDM